MRTTRYLLALALTSTCLFGTACTQPEAPHETAIEFEDLAPTQEFVEGWSLSFAPEAYIGEDLFQLINGGAELYHEIGFSRVLSAEYVDVVGRPITLELFEMADPGAAYGVYSFKIGSGGDPVAIGDGGIADGYYMNFRKGPYVVTLTGMDDSPETRGGMLKIAAAVEENIGAKSGELPDIVSELAEKSDRPDRVRYFRGDLALSNAVSVTAGAGFGMTEGASASVGEHQLMVLSYADPADAEAKLESAVQKLIDSGSFTEDDDAEGRRLIATDGRVFHLDLDGTRVIGVFGPDGDEVGSLLGSLRSGS